MSGESRSPFETILELTGLIYDSVSDSSRWPIFLEAFVRAVAAQNGNLALRDVDRHGFAFSCSHGWPDEALQRYKHYALIDPWRSGTERWPEGAVGLDTDLCSRAEFESSVACREFYAPYDAVHGIGGTILVSGTGQSLVIATRGAARGPFGEPEKAILRPLMPHLKRAALLHSELGSLRRQLAMFTDHLNRYSHAFLITDSEGRVLDANATAREAAALQDGLTMENGRLTITSPRQDAGFREAVAELSAGRGVPLRRVQVSRPSRKTPYRLILMPVEDSGAIPLGVSMPAVSILVVDAASRAEPDEPVLRELFSLTPAEARMAGKLALGRSLEEIAAESKISVETVRTHLKRTLSKTATERQGELISLILRSTPVRRP
jgi:DNA-binding CsgD family transcriptional regulator